MNVVPIHRSVCEETETVLSYLLSRAKTGECQGISLCAHINGAERVFITGKYLRNPAHGANAALRMSVRLAQLQEDSEAASR